MSDGLLFMAVFPVILLCFYIYIKDTNKEPFGLLAKIFMLGVLMAVPVVIVESILDIFFVKDGVTNFIILFISVFISVGLVEEGAKFIVTKFIGYNNDEFDEIYDVIVYSVFASLGFACIENVLYVFNYGFSTAIVRALLSVPGHMCFGVLMGYFLAMAKINSVNNRNGSYVKNMILSLIVPSLVHTLYDSFLFYAENVNNGFFIILFLVFDINMVVICFITVSMVSRMQVVINTDPVVSNNLSNIHNNPQTVLQNTDNNNNNNIQTAPQNNQQEMAYCPICGRYGANNTYCGRCGYKLK